MAVNLTWVLTHVQGVFQSQSSAAYKRGVKKIKNGRVTLNIYSHITIIQHNSQVVLMLYRLAASGRLKRNPVDVQMQLCHRD